MNKSTTHRETTLYEAYLVLSDQKERLERYLEKCLTITYEQRGRIVDHIIELSRWLRQNAKVIELQFDTTAK